MSAPSLAWRTDYHKLMRYEDDCWWEGREWVYFFSHSKAWLRRHHKYDRMVTSTIKCSIRPPTSLGLTKRFYQAWARPVPPAPIVRTIPQVPGDHRKRPYRSNFTPPRLYQLRDFTLQQLTDIHNRMVPEVARRSRCFTDLGGAMERVRTLLAGQNCILVDRIPAGAGARTVSARVHIVPREFVALLRPRYSTAALFALTDVVRLLKDYNPKTRGSASWQRWEKIADGMTVGEYIEACGTRGDIRWALEHNYIRLEPGVSLPPA